jgi:hypothetical protein
MTTTPRLSKSLTQVNSSDAPAAPGGIAVQGDGRIAGLGDGGYVVVWTHGSRTYNNSGSAVVAQGYDALGNKVVPAGNTHGGEVHISQFASSGDRCPAVTVLPNRNVAVAPAGGGSFPSTPMT